MSTHCSIRCLVITSLVITSPVPVKVKVGHTQKRSTMAKDSSEGELAKKKSVDHNKKRIENLSKANVVKEDVIHLDQLEFLPIYSELLTWMLPAPNVTDHSHFDKCLFENIHSSFFSRKQKTSLLPLYCRSEDYYLFFFMLTKKILRSATHGSTVPRTGSYMGSADT